jgi:alpha-D-ribose 1-methylphosphonate 5-triphosphate synthase subunit PhnG
MSETAPVLQQQRQIWMGILARAERAELETEWQKRMDQTRYRYMREPETGLVMVRGRAGGRGQRFSLGEMTVSRCAVVLEDSTIGHGYVKGRDKRHAELVALFDARFQQAGKDTGFLGALRQKQQAVRAREAAKAAATKVDFYTLTRGED